MAHLLTTLAKYYCPEPGTDGGPSRLTFLGHTKDSLWSVDLFRCESILLKSHWVLVVMDQFTCRIIGFGAHTGDVDGVAMCRMFNRAISGKGVPRYLSSDHDPLFEYHRWKANLHILDIEEIKTVPYAPLSRVCGTSDWHTTPGVSRPPVLLPSSLPSLLRVAVAVAHAYQAGVSHLR